MKKAATLTLATLVITGLCYATIVLINTLGNGKLTGKVTDAKTGEPIIGATISAYLGADNKATVATDLDGNYSLSLAAGTYRIETRYLGYELKKTENIKITADKSLVNNIALTESTKELSEIVVTEERPASISYMADEYRSVSPDVVGSSSGKSYYMVHEDASPSSPTTTGSYTAPASVSYTTPVAAETIKMSPYKATKSPSHKSASKAPAYKLADGEGKKSMADVKGKSTRFDVAKETETPKEAVKVEEKKAVREPDTRAGQLTAGEWSDNRNWDFFNGILKKSDWKSMEPTWNFNFDKRYYVKVTSGGKPQNDARVVLKDKKGKTIFEGRSDNNGNCYLFAGLFDKADDNADVIEVATEGGTKSVPAGSAGNTRPIAIDITARAKTATKLDVMFMIDATGSMSDEINYLKEELSDVVRRVKATNEQAVDIRLSANVYRDQGDEYVVRSFPFTSDVSKVLTDLNAQYAGGGGDFEEAVEDGLDDAINKHEWSEDASARILFLVLDAPPHNTPENKAKIQKAILNAAKKGIRIIPVTSSGIDKNTEFLMRFMSAATGGTYVFLTDHSGIGGSHIEPTIGKYDVEFLNNLMVRLINAYLTTES